MLQPINDKDNWISEIIKDDPIRKNLPLDFRINEHSQMFAYWNKDSLGSVCCVRYTQGIPESIDDMQNKSSDDSDTVTFYTVWSYSKGSGRTIINQATDWILEKNKNIKNVVTLSPKTEMAEKFHLSNGAFKYRENSDTINYAYILDE